MLWFIVPYLEYPKDELRMSEFAHDVFPAICVIVSLLVCVFGFLVCGWPSPPAVIPKRPFRTTSELFYLLLISIFEIFSNLVFLTTESSIALLIGFSLEIGFCSFELIYLGRASRLTVESLTHHVCTMFAIPMSLHVVRLPMGLLVQLSLSVAVGNAIICASKIIYRIDDSGKKFEKKKFGIMVSYWSSVVYRILIPTVDVFWVLYHFFFHMTTMERPGWTRLYLTSLLMLLALNYQMVYTMKRT